jgi:hypothetical protein
MSRPNRGLETLSSPHLCNKKVSLSNARIGVHYQAKKLVAIAVSSELLQVGISKSKAARKDCIAALL